MIRKACRNCSGEFTSKRNDSKYCSHNCYIEHRVGKWVEIQCGTCGKDLKYRERGTVKKFCSSSCSATYNNLQKRTDRYCLHCSELIGRNSKKYCSRLCQKLYRRRLYIDKWLSGEVSGNIGIQSIDLSSYVRKYLLEQAKYSCSLCGYSKRHKITGNYILSIDHIDGNHKNSRPENLRVLCPNCHAETETYGSLNSGRGRKYDRERKPRRV